MTVEEYSCALAVASTEIIAAAHRMEDTSPFIAAALSLEPPAGVNATYTLITLLAAQVNPDTDLYERLAWTNPDVQKAIRREAA